MNYLFFLKYLTYEAKLSTPFPSLFCHIISFTNKEIFPQKMSCIDRRTTLPFSLFICMSVCNTIQQPFTMSDIFFLSFSLRGLAFLPCCQVVVLVLTSKQARACAGVRQIETDEPSVCWTAAHASHHGGASKK